MAGELPPDPAGTSSSALTEGLLRGRETFAALLDVRDDAVEADDPGPMHRALVALSHDELLQVAYVAILTADDRCAGRVGQCRLVQRPARR